MSICQNCCGKGYTGLKKYESPLGIDTSCSCSTCGGRGTIGSSLNTNQLVVEVGTLRSNQQLINYYNSVVGIDQDKWVIEVLASVRLEKRVRQASLMVVSANELGLNEKYNHSKVMRIAASYGFKPCPGEVVVDVFKQINLDTKEDINFGMHSVQDKEMFPCIFGIYDDCAEKGVSINVLVEVNNSYHYKNEWWIFEV